MEIDGVTGLRVHVGDESMIAVRADIIKEAEGIAWLEKVNIALGNQTVEIIGPEGVMGQVKRWVEDEFGYETTKTRVETKRGRR